jgi:hypothetical protein
MHAEESLDEKDYAKDDEQDFQATIPILDLDPIFIKAQGIS